MKKLIILISAVFFIAATPLYINAQDTKTNKGFNTYERVNPENNWKNEYWPQHQQYMRNNGMHGMHYNQRMQHYRYRCYSDCNGPRNYNQHNRNFPSN